MACPVCNHESNGRLCRECGEPLMLETTAQEPGRPMQPICKVLALLIALIPDDGRPVLASAIPSVLAE